MSKIKVACCDDLEHLCRYLKRMIEAEEDFEFVAMAHDEAGCKQMVSDNEIDVLLLDIQMENNDSGANIISELKIVKPDMKIIMLTMHDENEFIIKSFVNGANDYLLKQDINTGLCEKIKQVYSDENVLGSKITNVIIGGYKAIALQNASIMWYIDIIRKLSASEFEILKLLTKGCSYRQIAKERFVSESTIRTHIHRICKKFEVDNIDVLVKTINSLGVFSLFTKKDKQ